MRYQLYNIPREKLKPKERIWLKSTLEELENLRKSPRRDSKFFRNNMQAYVKQVKMYD